MASAAARQRPIPVQARIVKDADLLGRVGFLEEELLVVSPRGRGEDHQTAQASRAQLEELARRQAECLDSLRSLQMDAEAAVAAGPELAQLESDALALRQGRALTRAGQDCERLCRVGDRPCTPSTDDHEDWEGQLEKVIERLITLGRAARVACRAHITPSNEESRSERDATEPASVTERIQTLLDRFLRVHAEANSQVLEGQARSSETLQARVQSLEAENLRLQQRVVDAEKGLLLQRAVSDGGGYEHFAAHFRTDPAFDSLHQESQLGLLPRASVRSFFRKAQPCHQCGRSPGIVFGLVGLGIWQRRHKRICSTEETAMLERPALSSQGPVSRLCSHVR